MCLSWQKATLNKMLRFILESGKIDFFTWKWIVQKNKINIDKQIHSWISKETKGRQVDTLTSGSVECFFSEVDRSNQSIAPVGFHLYQWGMGEGVGWGGGGLGVIFPGSSFKAAACWGPDVQGLDVQGRYVVMFSSTRSGTVCLCDFLVIYSNRSRWCCCTSP